jgi:hypothetical protein
VIDFAARTAIIPHDPRRENYRGLTMQEPIDLPDEQLSWLKQLLNSHVKNALHERVRIPADIRDALVERGLVRLWRNGDVEITLAGMVAVAHRLPRTQHAA